MVIECGDLPIEAVNSFGQAP
jgi:hypothetical protein